MSTPFDADIPLWVFVPGTYQTTLSITTVVGLVLLGIGPQLPDSTAPASASHLFLIDRFLHDGSNQDIERFIQLYWYVDPVI